MVAIMRLLLNGSIMALKLRTTKRGINGHIFRSCITWNLVSTRHLVAGS